MNRHEMKDAMLMAGWSAKDLLDELVRALSDDEAEENFMYIDRMWGTGVFDEEEED